MSKQIKTFDNGFYFPVIARIIGTILLGFAFLVAFTSTNEMGYIISAVLLFMNITVFTKTGVIIDRTKKALISYVSLYGIKIKKQQNLDKFMYVTLVHRNFVARRYSRSYVNLESKFSLYQTLLLNETHHKKFVVCSYTDIEEAEKESKKISQYLEWEYVKYNPVRTRKKTTTRTRTGK